MRILNVAEKNDAAKNIAALLSCRTAKRGAVVKSSPPVYEFEYEVFGENATMIMTCVKGHLMSHVFGRDFQKWEAVDPISLFEAPVYKVTLPDCKNIKETIEREIVKCSKLIIWTDCDREGENIGFEIIQVCKAVKKNVEIYRATFSEISAQSVRRALNNLESPNQHLSYAVDVRRELDLRIGAAFTRFQCFHLQKAFPDALAENMISYGSCQFPTLGFVVERFKAISEFRPESFWQLNVVHTPNELKMEFGWERLRLFHKLACQALYEKCVEGGTARVENVESKRKLKWRPKPLTTVELQKKTSRLFRLSAKETLKIAESLYTKGLISYPRTETDSFSKDIDLALLVQSQTVDPRWGDFAQRVLREGPDPFNGKQTDQAHPPIHPIRYSDGLTGNDRKVYEFITRHFLACLSKHATGSETIVDIDVAGEKFTAKGLTITAKNYLEVYPYDKWEGNEIYSYQKGDTFEPEICMREGETSPPELLTEADLISLMEKHGIGTDATHADHIEKVKERMYVGLQDDKYFVPRTLGMGLVEGYNSMGYPMARPEMRAELEQDLKSICERKKSPREVLATHIGKYKKLFEAVRRKADHLSRSIQRYIEVEAMPVETESFAPENNQTNVGKCPTCHSDLHLKTSQKGDRFIGCSAFPLCRVALWLPSFVLDVTPTAETCSKCGPDHYMLRFKMQKGATYFPPEYVGCIGGCDWNLLEVLNCNGKIGWSYSPRSLGGRETSTLHEINDSGFASLDEGPSKRTRSAADSPEGRSATAPGHSSPPNCDCGVPAACHVVKKSGRNEGKEFYCCGRKNRTLFGCNFFMWKKPLTRGTTRKTPPKAAVDEGELRCYCSIPCRRSKTTKEGPNKGRDFFVCAKPIQDPGKCDFFKWADENVKINSYKKTGYNRKFHRGT